jgi:hypothetical protein
MRRLERLMLRLRLVELFSVPGLDAPWSQDRAATGRRRRPDLQLPTALLMGIRPR